MSGLDLASRAALARHPVSQKLFQLMADKATNLCLSADVTTSERLLALARNVGSEICVLKTHIDIIEDFTPQLTRELRAIADDLGFILFEDRKFADIGSTVKAQFSGGMYRIATWADVVNAHMLPGPGIIEALRAAADKRPCACLLLAEMSAKGHLFTEDYQQVAVKWAQEYSDFIVGFISQHALGEYPQWLVMTPGVQFDVKGDALGQQYRSPERAIIEQGCDIAIVGRGIIQAKNPVETAKIYRQKSWQALNAR